MFIEVLVYLLHFGLCGVYWIGTGVLWVTEAVMCLHMNTLLVPS